jgi:PAS domain S-box-containing protein
VAKTRDNPERMPRLEIEDALRESEYRYRQLFQRANDAIFLMQNDTFVECNNKTLDMFGCLREQIIGHPPYAFSPTTQPDGRDSTEAALERIEATLNGEPQYFEWQHSRADGTLFDAEVSLGTVQLNTGMHILAIVRDVTARKHAEEEKRNLENQLHRAEKMKAIGQLTGGIAHDFNNMLSGIVGYADILERKIGSDNEFSQFINGIRDTANRAADLARQLLTFSKQGKSRSIDVNMHDLIGEVAQLLERTTDRRISIKLDYQAKNCMVIGDPSQLQNTILNLAINAGDSMPNGGQIVLRSQLVHLKESNIRQQTLNIVPGEYFELDVSDTGCGMEPQVLSRIFEPFYTTKEIGSGTGLGLAMVYGTIKAHGGAIEVTSSPGQGSCFKVYLPIQTKTQTIKTKTEKPKLISGKGLILAVDDESIIREVITDILTDLGYEVITAVDGEQAVELFSRRSTDIDLVVLDMIMPKLNGLETLRELKKFKADVRVLVVSGFSRKKDLVEITQEGIKGFLHKPFSSVELSQKIAQILNQH